MHILVTDVLTCPRCGPTFGLILLADGVIDRRVSEGRLGCSNCRERYPVRAREADFSAAAGSRASHGADAAAVGARGEMPPRDPEVRDPEAPGADGEAVVRLAALLGLEPHPMFVVLAGPAVRHAGPLAALMEGPEVLAITGRGSGEVAAGAGVSPLRVPGARLPLASGKAAAVALTGRDADALLEEGARAVSPVGRLLLDPAPADADARLSSAGLRVAARQGEVVLATRVI